MTNNGYDIFFSGNIVNLSLHTNKNLKTESFLNNIKQDSRITVTATFNFHQH